MAPSNREPTEWDDEWTPTHVGFVEASKGSLAAVSGLDVVARSGGGDWFDYLDFYGPDVPARGQLGAPADVFARYVIGFNPQ